MFDYPDENFFDAPERRVQNTIMMAKAGGEPMQSAFSYSELEKLLEKHGFLIYELLTPDDIQRNVIDKAGADLKAFEHVNDCLAVRKYESERWQNCQKREDFLFDSMKENMNLSASLSGSFVPQGLFRPPGCIPSLIFCSLGIISPGRCSSQQILDTKLSFSVT